jgi:hypothetical protein
MRISLIKNYEQKVLTTQSINICKIIATHAMRLQNHIYKQKFL